MKGNSIRIQLAVSVGLVCATICLTVLSFVSVHFRTAVEISFISIWGIWVVFYTMALKSVLKGFVHVSTMSLISLAALLVLTSSSVWVYILDNLFPCLLYKWVLNICSPLIIIPYCIRARRTRSRSFQRLSNDSILEPLIAEHGAERRKSVSHELKTLAPFLIPFLVLSVVESLAHIEIIPFPFSDIISCKTTISVSIPLSCLLWILIHSCIAITLLFHYDKCPPSSCIRIELLTFVLIGVLYAITFLITLSTHETGSIQFLAVDLIRGISLTFVSLSWPISYQLGRLHSAALDRMLVSSLRDLLTSKVCFPYFLQFMKRIEQESMLMFWVHVQVLCELEDPKAVEQETKEIFRTYFESPEESVNECFLSHRKAIQTCIEKRAFFAVFNDCEECVFQQLEDTFYQLFLRSDECKHLLTRLSETENDKKSNICAN